MSNNSDAAGKATLPPKTIRAKFICLSVTDAGDSKSVLLTAVTGNSPENQQYWKYTPSGRIELSVLNPDVKFTPQKSYYVDFIETE